MNGSPDNNPLDRAILALRRSRAALPDLCRALGDGELWLLVRFHPEIANTDLEFKPGMPFPFARLQTDQGEVVPAYSCEERLNEGLEAGRVPPRTYLSAAMPARQALEMLGHLNLPIVLNKGCATGEVTLPPNLLRDLADSTALKPCALETRKTEQLQLDVLNPADYPTSLVQALFELVRRHRHFRAVWIFTRSEPGPPPPEHRPYYLLVLMEPRDETLFHDFNLVAQSARGGHPLHLSLADENDPAYIARLFRQVRPFYVAADYRSPEDPAASRDG